MRCPADTDAVCTATIHQHIRQLGVSRTVVAMPAVLRQPVSEADVLSNEKTLAVALSNQPSYPRDATGIVRQVHLRIVRIKARDIVPYSRENRAFFLQLFCR